MKARDVMVSPSSASSSSASVREVAEPFLEHRISRVAIIDDQGRLVGIVSEGDLLHRVEAGTDQRADAGARVHGRRALPELHQGPPARGR